MPGAQRDRERLGPSGKQGQQEGWQSPPPEWPGVLSALLASLRVSGEFAEEERWGHWALKWESKRLTRNTWSPSLIKNLRSMTRVLEAPRPPHFLSVIELKQIVPRILHYQCPSCGCERLTNEQAGPLQRGFVDRKRYKHCSSLRTTYHIQASPCGQAALSVPN